MTTAFIELPMASNGFYTDGLNSDWNQDPTIGVPIAPTNVNDPFASPDDDNTFVSLQQGQRWSFLPTTPNTAGATNISTISSLFVRLRAAAKGHFATVNAGIFFRRAGLNYDQSNAAFTGAYSQTDYTLLTDPTTGLPWQASDFNTGVLEVGFYIPVGGNGDLHCTQLYVKMTYVPNAWTNLATASAASFTVQGPGTAAGWGPFLPGANPWTRS